MVLAVTSDLTIITSAEAADDANWVGIGSGGSDAQETDYFVQGSASRSRAVNTATEKGMWYSFSAVNFETNDDLIYIWVATYIPGLCDTIALGGLSIRVGSSTTNYDEFYVGGNDFGIPSTDFFKVYVIDPQATPSTTGGSGCDTTAVTHIGATIDPTGSSKGQTIGIDQIAYGQGVIRGTGTSTTGAGFGDFVIEEVTNDSRWGIVTERAGIIYVKGRIVIGDDSGTLATTFTSNNETVVFETPMYYNGTNRVKAIPDENPSGANYWGLDVVGNATGATTFSIGTQVGSTEFGRSGSTLSVAANPEINSGETRQSVKMTMDANVNDLDLYAATFNDWTTVDTAEDVFDLNNADVNDLIYSCTFNGCGQIDTGAGVVRNCFFISTDHTATATGQLVWLPGTTDVEDSQFIDYGDAAIYMPDSNAGAGDTWTGLTFDLSGTHEMNYTDTESQTITIVGGTAATSLASDDTSGVTTFTGAVTVSIEVVDLNDTAIENASVAVVSARTNLQVQTDFGAVGLWDLDEPTGVMVDSINGNDGTATNFASQERARGTLTRNGGGSALFDGSNNRVTVTDTAVLQNVFDGGGSVVAAFSALSDGALNVGAVARKSGWRWFVNSESGGFVALTFQQLFSGTNGQWDTDVDIPLGKNIYVVVTYDADAVGNNPTMYIWDGTSFTTRTVGDGLTESTGPPTGTRTTDVGTALTIGNDPGDATSFDGHIDDFGIYDSALTSAQALDILESMQNGVLVMNERTLSTGIATESYTGPTPQAVSVRVRKSSKLVSEVYDDLGATAYWLLGESSGNAIDGTGGGNDGTVTLAETRNTTALTSGGDGAIRFNGTSNGVIAVPNATAVENIWDGGASVAFAINVDDAAATARSVFRKSGFWWCEAQDESGALFRFECGFGKASGDHRFVTAVDIPTNTDVYGVLTYNADSLANDATLYVWDGTSVTTRTVGAGLTQTEAGTGARDDDSGQAWNMGSNNGTSGRMDGDIDDIAIFDGELSSTYALRIIDAMIAGAATRYNTVTVPQSISTSGLSAKFALTEDLIAT